MPAVIEFGMNNRPVFAGVDSLERKLKGLDNSVVTSQQKLSSALRNPWVSAGVDQQKYLAQLVATERQTRQIAAAQAKLASYKGPQAASSAVNPWATAGAADYAAQQKAAAAAAAAAVTLQSQQRAAEAAAIAQQRLAAVNAAAQSKAMAAAAAAAAVAAAEQRSAALQTNNGRMNLALLEAQIAGNKKEAASIQSRISLMERMRTIQAQTNVSQREAYTLAQRSAGIAAVAGRGGRGWGVGMAAMQAQDIAVQMQMGTRYSTIMAQQGSQLLSIFGPAGMIAGGLLAVGAGVVTVRQRGEEAFEKLKNEAASFDDKLMSLKQGGVDQMIEGMKEMADRARDARDAMSTPDFARYFYKTTYDAAGRPHNEYDDKKRQAYEVEAENNERGRKELQDQIVRASGQELRIADLRAASRDREAAALERHLAVTRIWARADKMGMDPEAKKQYTENEIGKLAAQQQISYNEEVKKKQEEMEKIAAAQMRLDEQKKDAALDQMTLAQRIALMSVEAQKALAEENRLKHAAKLDTQAIIDAESRRVSIQAQILSTQRQLVNEKEREAEAAKRTAEQVAREAEQAAQANATRKATVLDTEMEYRILEAKAAGRKKEAEELERQARIIEKARRLEQQNGLDPQGAMSLAMKTVALEDRIAGKGAKIYSKPKIDNDPDGRFGLWGKPSKPLYDSKPLYQSKPLTKNGGLAGFWALQYGQTGQLGTGPSQFAMQNAFSTSPSLQAFHAANATKQDHAATGPAGAVVTEIQKLIAITARGFFGG